jgi:hypothetical protein
MEVRLPSAGDAVNEGGRLIASAPTASHADPNFRVH